LQQLKQWLKWLIKQWQWLKWPVAIAILVFLYNQHQESFQSLMKEPLNWTMFFIALSLCATSIVLTFFRWFLLVWAQEFPFQISDALRLSFIAYLFNYVSPGATGGDLVKAVMIAREQRDRRVIAVLTVFLDRLLGVFGLFLVGSFAIFLQPQAMFESATIKSVMIVMIAGSLAGFFAMVILLQPALLKFSLIHKLQQLPIVGRIFAELLQAAALYQTKRLVLVLAVLISIVGHFGMLSSFYFCSRALPSGQSAPGYWAQIMLVPGAELIGVLAPTPGGTGALEYAVGRFYRMGIAAMGANAEMLELAAATGVTTAVVYRLVTLIIAAVGGGYYLVSKKQIDAALKQNTEANPLETQQAS